MKGTTLQQFREREFIGVESQLTARIHKVFYAVYNELGHGFLESIYREAMTMALVAAGLKVETEVPLPVSFRGKVIGTFRADMIVEGKVIVELKSAAALSEAHQAQIVNYLRATPIEIGLLFNFGPEPQSRRFDFPNTRKRGLA